MAFQLPAAPNFTPQTPEQPDMLHKYGQMMQLKNMLNEQTLRQQLAPLQVQQAQLGVEHQQTANEASALELQSQKAMMQAWSDPKFLSTVTGGDGATGSGHGFDPDAMTKELVTRGVNPKDALGLTNSFTERSLKIAQMKKDEVSNYEKAHEQLAEGLGPIVDMKAGDAAKALDAYKQKLLKSPIPGLDETDLALVQHADLEHLPAMINALELNGKIAKYHKEQADTKKAELEATEAEHASRGELTPKMKLEQQNKVAVAEAEGRARANIEHEFAVRNNAALSNVPTHLVPSAAAASEKANKEYADAKSVSDRMAATMDAARKGNVVSYQIIPQEGTLQLTTSQGVHRINRTEIEQYAGGGSLWQRLEGHLGKALTGKSIPDSVLSDMAEIQKIQADGARSRYENTLKSINQTYGAKFEPVKMEGLGGKEESHPFFSKFGGTVKK